MVEERHLLEWACLISAHWTFWTGLFFFAGSVLCIVGLYPLDAGRSPHPRS